MWSFCEEKLDPFLEFKKMHSLMKLLHDFNNPNKVKSYYETKR